MEDRKRFSKLQDKATKKGEKDDEKSLSEFMSVTGEVVLYREYVTLSPDNIDNIDEEENQGGDLTQQNEEEGDGDQDEQTAEGKVAPSLVSNRPSVAGVRAEPFTADILTISS